MTNSSNKKRVLSGMRSTGKLHLGNYVGALENWVRMQDAYDCFFFIADWHALTTDYADTSRLKENSVEVTVEMPLKAIIRGYSYTVIPINWTNRKTSVSKLKLAEMGSRYLFIVLYLWLEKVLSRDDYHRHQCELAFETEKGPFAHVID